MFTSESVGKQFSKSDHWSRFNCDFTKTLPRFCVCLHVLLALWNDLSKNLSFIGNHFFGSFSFHIFFRHSLLTKMVLHTLTKKITSSWDGVIQRVQIFSEEVFLDLRNSVFPFINRVMFDQRKIYVLNLKNGRPTKKSYVG